MSAHAVGARVLITGGTSGLGPAIDGRGPMPEAPELAGEA
jgi:hypothetical protein